LSNRRIVFCEGAIVLKGCDRFGEGAIAFCTGAIALSNGRIVFCEGAIVLKGCDRSTIERAVEAKRCHPERSPALSFLAFSISRHYPNIRKLTMDTAREQLIQELNEMPDFVAQEVLDFLLFLKVRLKQKIKAGQTANSLQSPGLPPFLQFVEEISAQVPREEWEKLPKDLSKNLDHYLYGAPKDEE